MPHEFAEADTHPQRLCVNNCQDKTYRAFDLYMDIAQRHVARRNFRHYVDISKFTGMEIEHRHDTANQIPNQHDLHASSED